MDGEQTNRGAIPTWTKYGVMAVVYVVIHVFIGRLKIPKLKQWLSTCSGGLNIVFLLGTWYLRHFIIIVLINIVIILLCKKSNRFLISFFYSFLYLGYYFLLKHLDMYTPAFIGDFDFPIVALVLKLVHLAGEVQDVSEIEQNKNQKLERRLKVYTSLSVMDILHYSFSHVSVFSSALRYRTYYDWIHHPLSEYAVRSQVYELKKRVAYCCLLVIINVFVMPLRLQEKMDVKAFHSLHPLWQVLYLQSLAFYFAIHMYGMWAMKDMLLIISGLGAYPVSTKPEPGQGPTTNLELLEDIYNDPAKARQQEYNYDASRHIFLYKTFTIPTLREFWRCYNCHHHYFLKTNVYLKFPIKRLRLLAAFMVSAYFHGWSLFSYFNWFSSAIYIEAENMWRAIAKKRISKTPKKTVDLLFWLSRMFAQGQAFGTLVLLVSFDAILLYNKTTYFIPILYPTIMFILASVVK